MPCLPSFPAPLVMYCYYGDKGYDGLVICLEREVKECVHNVCGETFFKKSFCRIEK
jgi:hypothetical protein